MQKRYIPLNTERKRIGVSEKKDSAASKAKKSAILHFSLTVSHCDSNLKLRMDGSQLVSQFLLRERRGSKCAVPPETELLTASRARLLMQAAFVKVCLSSPYSDKYTSHFSATGKQFGERDLIVWLPDGELILNSGSCNSHLNMLLIWSSRVHKSDLGDTGPLCSFPCSYLFLTTVKIKSFVACSATPSKRASLFNPTQNYAVMQLRM